MRPLWKKMLSVVLQIDELEYQEESHVFAGFGNPS